MPSNSHDIIDVTEKLTATSASVNFTAILNKVATEILILACSLTELLSDLEVCGRLSLK